MSLPGASGLLGAAGTRSDDSLRLAVSGGDALWSGAAPRLRGATLEKFSNDPATYDAALLVEPGRIMSEQIERGLSAGRTIVLVADAWLSEEVLGELTAAAQRGGASLGVINSGRYLPSRQLIRQHLDEGKLGEPGLVRMHRWEPAGRGGATTGVPTPLLRDLDIVLFLVGQLPNSIYAIRRLANDRDTSGGQSLQVHLGFPGGGMATLDYADRLPPGDDYVSLTLIGSNGAAYGDDHQNVQLAYRGGPARAVRAAENRRQMVAVAQEVVDTLKAKRDFSAGVTAWRNVLAVAGSVRQSIASRQAINQEKS